MVTVLPPSGNAVASKRAQPLTEERLAQFSVGSGGDGRTTPDLATLVSRGQELAALLFGDEADEILARTTDSKLVVIHDLASSRLPFETLSSATSGPPASSAGMSRRLAVSGVPVERLFARPSKSDRFNVLLVIDPTGDLPGTVTEGEAVRAILEQQDGVDLRTLRQDEATKQAFLEALESTDVLHYCGHAFFDGPGETQSGLVLAGREAVTLAAVRCMSMPRVAFVNACEAGRVRGSVTTEAASFAELFLRGGVDAYLGTFWRVGDQAAKTFAGDVYAQLASGRTLEEAVTHARKTLEEARLSDWANYLLYGDGRFRLLARQ